MITWVGNRVLVFLAGIVEGWCGLLAATDRRRYQRRTAAVHGPVQKRVAWPQRGTCQGGECSVVTFTDPAGDLPVALWCEKHCNECRTTPDGSRVPCVLHDKAWTAEMRRRCAP